jgi:predicted RNA-binding Zn-ribbon protein involved in translation (DUF1610 family)
VTPEDWKPRWAPKVPQAKIRRLYANDARGVIDDELIDQVGWGLWERCDSILTVTAAHYGQVRCPLCGTSIARQNRGAADEEVRCGTCGWQIPWAVYHQTYRGKQLFGANAIDVFAAFLQAFPRAQTATARMLLIDQLIHAFHVGLTEVGRPVAANLIQGSLTQVIRFLGALTHGDTSATGVTSAQMEWRRTLGAASWSQPFISKTESDG